MIRVASKVEAGGRGCLARRLNGEEIEAEEDAGGDAERVAERACGPQLETLRQKRRPAGETEREPREHAARHSLTKHEPAEQHDPDRRGRGEEGRVGDARMHDGEVPEEQIPGEGEPGQDRRPREPLARRPAALDKAHPCVEQRQGERDAPEGAGEGPDVGEPDEDRRHSHRYRPSDERDEGRERAAPHGSGSGCRVQGKYLAIGGLDARNWA